VEAAVRDRRVLLRRSTDPEGQILVIPQSAWRDLIANIKRRSLQAPKSMIALPAANAEIRVSVLLCKRGDIVHHGLIALGQQAEWRGRGRAGS